MTQAMTLKDLTQSQHLVYCTKAYRHDSHDEVRHLFLYYRDVLHVYCIPSSLLSTVV